MRSMSSCSVGRRTVDSTLEAIIVDLHHRNKLKNIEATERAKRQLLRKGMLEEA